MRVSSHCNDPTESDSQLGCISLVFIACAVTSTVLAVLLVGFLAWRQRSENDRACQAATRQQDIDLEERAFGANAFTRAESVASNVSGAPPSYRSRREDDDDDVMVVSAPMEGPAPAYEERGRGEGETSGKMGGGGEEVRMGKYPLPETRHDSMDLRLEDLPLEKGVPSKTR